MVKLKVKKNVVFFSVDSRRQDLYSVYGGFFHTPNLERMAKTGTVFNNMYSASASTEMSLSSLINGTWCHNFHRFFIRSQHHQHMSFLRPCSLTFGR